MQNQDKSQKVPDGDGKTADQDLEVQNDEPSDNETAKEDESPTPIKKTAKAATEDKTEKENDAKQNSKQRTASQKPNFEVKPIRTMHTKEPAAKEKEETQEKPQDWLDSEGQLAIDVFQTDEDLVIQAPIAGMKVEDLDVIIEEEVVTIKGNRKNPFTGKPSGQFIEECYWGPFSRKIILPLDTDGARADASMKEGVLTIRIPKILREKKRKVSIRE